MRRGIWIAQGKFGENRFIGRRFRLDHSILRHRQQSRPRHEQHETLQEDNGPQADQLGGSPGKVIFPAESSMLSSVTTVLSFWFPVLRSSCIATAEGGISF